MALNQCMSLEELVEEHHKRRTDIQKQQFDLLMIEQDIVLSIIDQDRLELLKINWPMVRKPKPYKK